MAETMKAVVKTKGAPGAELKELPVPRPGPNEALIKIEATSICGTDVHIYEWDKWAQGRIKNIPQTLGHEAAGEVVEVGSQCFRVKVGDYVSAETHIPCNTCKQCLTDQMHICANLKILGVDCDGVFAEYAAIPEQVLWKNDRNVPPELACVQEPLGNAIYCTTVRPVFGQHVLIFGDGPTALFSAAVASVAGAARIYLVYRHPARAEIARKVGADVLINDHEEDVEKIVLEGTDGVGADVVLDMAGTQRAIDTALRLVRKGGRFSAFGVAKDKVEFDINNGIVFKGADMLGINGRLMFKTWFEARELLKHKKLDISPIVTHKLDLEDYAKGFDLMTTRPKISGKVVLFPGGIK